MGCDPGEGGGWEPAGVKEAVGQSPRAAILLGLALVLASCDDPPAPTPDPAPEAAAEPAPEPAIVEEDTGPPPGVDHTIGPGQTLWAIARAYGVSVPAIMEANDLRPRDVRRLREGNTLRIPGATAVLTELTDPSAHEELPPITDGATPALPICTTGSSEAPSPLR